MHDPLLMHMFECAGDLGHVVPNGGLIELKVFAFLFFDEALEVTSFCPLGDNDEFIVVDEGVDVLDNVRVIEFFHDVDLAEALFSLALISHVEDLFEVSFTLIFLSAKGIPC